MTPFYLYRRPAFCCCLKYLAVSIMVLVVTQSTMAQNNIRLQWKLSPQSETEGNGSQVSDPGFQTKNWIAAVVPGTVFYAYVKAGREKNPDFGENIYQVDKAKYNQPYWYRAEFQLPVWTKGKRLWLKFNGINKIADIYFNSKHIGTLKGLMERGIYDVTPLLKKSGRYFPVIFLQPQLYRNNFIAFRRPGFTQVIVCRQ